MRLRCGHPCPSCVGYGTLGAYKLMRVVYTPCCGVVVLDIGSLLFFCAVNTRVIENLAGDPGVASNSKVRFIFHFTCLS